MKKNEVEETEISQSDGGDLAKYGVGESMGGKGTEKLQIEEKDEEKPVGYSCYVAAFFMVAQTAGPGFLPLPRGIADMGWTGAFLMIFFCIISLYTAIRLGSCWNILEERWERYRQPAREPYMDLAEMSLGMHGRRLVSVSVVITQLGCTITYIILMSEMMAELVPALSQCEWTLVVTIILWPFTWLDSLKDFWQASVLAVVAAILAIVVIVVKLLVERDLFLAENPTYPSPTFFSFSLGYGALLFAYGGAACFPTVQNDMKSRSDFWISSVISFSVIMALYIPIGIAGYIYLGNYADANIFRSVGSSLAVTIAIAMQIANLLGTFLIALSPAVLSLEATMKIPRKFGWQRVSMRSGLILLELVVAFAVPDFGLILNLIGSSTMSILTFILPPLMYIKLADNKTDFTWPERNVHLSERCFAWLVIAIGTFGGLSGTVSAAIALFQPSSFKNSCFLNFL